MNEEEKLKMYLTILNDENPSYVKENAKANIITLFEKQQNKIEDLKKEKSILIEKYTDVVNECVERNNKIEYLQKRLYRKKI